MTSPALPDGTPFPTVYYLTCPRAAAAIGTLEAQGVMKQFTADLDTDAALAGQYRTAHEQYLADRQALGVVAQIAGVSAGGMPTRVKCLHVLVAHSLARGAGVNPLGDRALDLLAQVGITAEGSWGGSGPCIAPQGEQGGDRS
jgi:hypothetical protein